MRQVDLCGGCVEKLKSAYHLRQVSKDAAHRIVCAECRKPRYGGRFEVGSKKP